MNKGQFGCEIAHNTLLCTTWNEPKVFRPFQMSTSKYLHTQNVPRWPSKFAIYLIVPIIPLSNKVTFEIQISSEIKPGNVSKQRNSYLFQSCWVWVWENGFLLRYVTMKKRVWSSRLCFLIYQWWPVGYGRHDVTRLPTLTSISPLHVYTIMPWWVIFRHIMESLGFPSLKVFRFPGRWFCDRSWCIKCGRLARRLVADCVPLLLLFTTTIDVRSRVALPTLRISALHFGTFFAFVWFFMFLFRKIRMF